VLALAVAADIVLGLAFAWAQGTSAGTGLYFATVTATTVGYGDIAPRGWLPHLLAVTIMLTVIPLFASVFSLLTTGLTTDHVDARHAELKRHVTGSMRDHEGDEG
jgi:voltage-gated potassium channel